MAGKTKPPASDKTPVLLKLDPEAMADLEVIQAAYRLGPRGRTAAFRLALRQAADAVRREAKKNPGKTID